jgi:DinB superfamily
MMENNQLDKDRYLAVLILAVGVLVVAAQTQEVPKAAPKPAPSTSEAVLEPWNEIGRKLIAMAEDCPDNKYDFKPTPAVRSFAERLIHAAYSNQLFTNTLLGQKLPGMDEPKREQFKTKADLVAFVKQSFADGAAAIKAKGDKGMSDLVVDPFTNRQTRATDFAHGFIEHSEEIYGQLTVYYRVASLIPPESRPKK